MATRFESLCGRQDLEQKVRAPCPQWDESIQMPQELYGIRSEPFDDPSSDHHSVFLFDISDVFCLFEGLTTVESPELIPIFPPSGG